MVRPVPRRHLVSNQVNALVTRAVDQLQFGGLIAVSILRIGFARLARGWKRMPFPDRRVGDDHLVLSNAAGAESCQTAVWSRETKLCEQPVQREMFVERHRRWRQRTSHRTDERLAIRVRDFKEHTGFGRVRPGDSVLALVFSRPKLCGGCESQGAEVVAFDPDAATSRSRISGETVKSAGEAENGHS